MQMKKEDKQTGLCPCSGKCCDKPDLFCPEHVCKFSDICEDCFTNECNNCGNSCCCDL